MSAYKILWTSSTEDLRVVHVPRVGAVMQRKDYYSGRWVLDVKDYSMVQVADMIADAVKQASP